MRVDPVRDGHPVLGLRGGLVDGVAVLGEEHESGRNALLNML